LTKAPSAELRPNQTDQDTLPPYDLLDFVLSEYLEKNTPVEMLEAQLGAKMDLKTGARAGWVREILRKVELNEFKRRQAAPVLKISTRAFGIGRRIPVAKSWNSTGNLEFL
jgi:NH3-dependent NAD+ synthetase